MHTPFIDPSDLIHVIPRLSPVARRDVSARMADRAERLRAEAAGRLIADRFTDLSLVHSLREGDKA